jgi:YD repeat-containing protein
MNKLTIIILLFSTNLLLGQSFLDKDLNLQGAVRTVYQLEFKAIEKDGKILKGDTIECSELKYEFDNHNRLLKEEYCLMDFLSSYNYKYDENGRLIKRMNFDRLDRKYEYDDSGYQLKELMFDSEGLMGSWSYKYDINGNRIERTGYLGESFVERWIKLYDQDNRKIKEYMVDEEPDSIPTYQVITFEYDPKGRLTKILTTDPETNVQAISTFKYDENDNLIEHFSKNDFQRGLEELKTLKYQYDTKGNWTQRIEYVNSKPTTIAERKIEYR